MSERPDLRLRPLRLDDEEAVRAAQREMAGAVMPFAFDLDDGTDWPAYVAATARHQRGLDLAPGHVPATYLVATLDGVVVGRSSIRHELNDRLRTDGGHIGYCVLPAHRRRGCATEILRQSLVVARAVGVDRALLSCEESNAASAAVIERCGGVLDPEWPRTDGTPVMLRYWIP